MQRYTFGVPLESNSVIHFCNAFVVDAHLVVNDQIVSSDSPNCVNGDLNFNNTMFTAGMLLYLYVDHSKHAQYNLPEESHPTICFNYKCTMQKNNENYIKLDQDSFDIKQLCSSSEMTRQRCNWLAQKYDNTNFSNNCSTVDIENIDEKDTFCVWEKNDEYSINSCDNKNCY